jgi:hypothetical protein
MKPRRGILVALDSVGIDPRGHDHADSVYRDSAFLFPRGRRGSVLDLPDAPIEGALVETDVVGASDRGAIECAITYTSIFTGKSAVDRHGLMQGLGLKGSLLEALVAESNLFAAIPGSCLANALFPAHLPFLGGSYAEDLVPHVTREAVEAGLRFRGEPVRLTGKKKHALAELFTLAEINQNIFVHAARRAGVTLPRWDDVRRGRALTSSLTHELEADFDVSFFEEEPLKRRTPAEAAKILATLSGEHPFVFYKFQMPDLVSHTARVELARGVFAVIEDFLAALLGAIDRESTFVVVTSDHGHLEQVGFTHGHPKTKVPTWVFGRGARDAAASLARPERIFDLVLDWTGASQIPAPAS